MSLKAFVCKYTLRHGQEFSTLKKRTGRRPLECCLGRVRNDRSTRMYTVQLAMLMARRVDSNYVREIKVEQKAIPLYPSGLL